MNATKIIHCDKYGVKSRFIEVDIYPYFEQKKNVEQNTGEKRRQRTGSAEQKRSRKEPSREQEELFGSVIREMFP